MGKMSKCCFKSLCGKLVFVVQGDDILLAGPRSLVDAAQKSLSMKAPRDIRTNDGSGTN